MSIKDKYNWDFILIFLGLGLFWFLIFLGINVF